MNIAFAALIAAALLDIYTTHRGIKLPGVEESNPIARRLFGPKPKLWPMAIVKAAAVGALIYLNVGTVGYIVAAAAWGAVSLHNLKIIRRREDANG